MIRMWIDDVRPAPKNWLWCKTAEDAMLVMDRAWDLIKEISFDHDLGDNSKTGYDVAKWIEERVFVDNWTVSNKLFHIHSANPVGRKNIKHALDKIVQVS